MLQLRGVYTALVTPFTDQGTLDEEGLRENIRFQIREGVDGVVALGTTGEAPTLSEQEKVDFIRIAKEETQNKTHLMIGTGSYSTEQTIRQSRLAEELGADSVLVITPYYNKPTQEGVYQHFKSVAESIQIPLVLYNHPGRTGSRIETKTLLRLADILNIVGVKDATADLATLGQLSAKLDASFSILSGDDSLTLPTIAIGGHGVVSVASNIVPGQMVQLVQAAFENNYKKAREIQKALTDLFTALSYESNPIPVKAAMNLLGMPSGSCRLPLTPLSEKYLQKLKHHLPNGAALSLNG